MSKAKTFPELKTLSSVTDEQKQATEPQPDPKVTAKEGETPVINFEPYVTHRYEETVQSQQLIDKSNKLAASIWKDQAAYTVGKDYRSYLRTPHKTSPDTIIAANNEYFDFNKIKNIVQGILCIEGVRVNEPEPYYHTGISHTVRKLILKIASLEKKYGSDAVITESKRDNILKSIFFRDIYNETQTMGWYNPSAVDLVYDKQPALVNEYLSLEDMQLLSNIINYVPRLRFLFGTKAKNTPADVIDTVLQKIDFTKIYMSTTSVSDEAIALMQKIERLPEFFYTVIPSQISSDFIKTNKNVFYGNGDRFETVRNTSTELRNVAIKYANDERTLADLLEAIVSLVESYSNYYQEIINNIHQYFDYLNRIEVSFKDMVDDVKEGYIERFSSPPF